MRTRKTVEPFRGKLPELIRRRYGKRRKLSKKELLEREAKGLEKRTFVNTRRKEIDAIFSIYNHVITPDHFLLQLLGKEMRFKNYRVLLLEKFDLGMSYLRLKFPDDMSDSFRQDQTRMRKELEKLTDYLCELTTMKTPVDDRMRRLKKYVRKPMYTQRLVEQYSDLLERVFKILGIEVATKQKRNTAINLSYIQFSLPSTLESALNKSSKEDSEQYEVLKRALDIQEKELETKLEQKGFIVRKTRDFFGDRGATYATVAYDPQIKNLGDPPRKPRKRKGEAKEVYEARVQESGYLEQAESYSEASKHFIKGIYSPYFTDEKGGYRVFEKKKDYQEAFVEKRKKEIILSSNLPVVEEEKIQIGTKTVTKRDGTTVEKPVYEFLSKITYEGSDESYPLTRYDVSALSGDTRTAQITDDSGKSATALSRIVKVKGMVVGDKMVDVITEGAYKGFLLEDMVNASGRLIEGSFYTRSANGEVQKLEILSSVYDFGEEKGDSVKTNKEEVSFLDVGEGNKNAKYMKVLKNRLKEPYITLSSDKKRLILGLPSGDSSKQDRNAVKKLASILPGLDQKKDPRLAPTVNGLNPFYYFDASSYEAVRDTLGSVAISKGALDFLDNYYKELTARDRALNEENLRRFTPDSIGGFVSEFKGRPFRFNNKQREAMAWMEANEYSGMMALDTGVGKTLLAGGAMRHFMKTRETSDSTAQFLFVSPKRLQGNFSKEMKDFMSDYDQVKGRIMEMNYTKFAKIVRGIDRIEDTMKMTDPKKQERRLRDLPADYWNDPDDLSKGSSYKDSTDYFKKKYSICFFDEVNEALTGMKRKAISDLKHPRKVLLTASAMEKDPLDLYRFVAIAKGGTFSKAKEQAFMERFGNVIGGRFVGLKNDPQVREEFNTWVKANAYFAFKQDVDLEEIGMPDLLTPTSEVITVRMDEEVEKEYRKLAKNMSRELKAMVKKYREVIKKGESFNKATFGEGKNAITDFAAKSLSKIKDLVTLTTNPSKYFGKEMSNPKLDQAERLMMDRAGKSICYFSADATIVRKNAKRLSESGVGGVHAALLPTKIEFFRAGKTIGKIEKKTGKSDLLKIDELTRKMANEGTFSPLEIDYSFIINNARGGQKLFEQTKDLFQIVEKNLFDYKNALEDEEKEDMDKAFNLLLSSLRSEDIKATRTARKRLETTYYKVFDFVADQWAILATKKIFKDNLNIRTLSCTDEYAKGYNFQFISTVVHLDRGKGFDSEEVKQRTARAYRTGQKSKVEVIYLDSVIADGGSRSGEYGASEEADTFGKDYSDMTVDEIKDLVQGADQDFFMDIIQQGMRTNLIANYEGVERTTGASIKINKNMFSMLLDPSSTNLKKVRDDLESEDTNPLSSLALNPNRFLGNGHLLSAIQTSSNSEDAKLTADLSGISSIADIQLNSNDNVTVVEGGHIVSQSSMADLEVIIEDNLDKTRTIYNKKLKFSPCLPSEAPARMVFGQIASAMVDKNVSVVKADGDSNDHMTLPMLGYNASITLPFLNQHESTLGEEEKQIKAWLEDNERISNGSSVCLNDLFLCLNNEESELIGQNWWKENGNALNGMNLSLNTNKTSMKVLNIYFKMKCNEFDLDISEYLSKAIEPFNVDESSCWALFMKNDKTERVLSVISKYKREFKLAFYSSQEVRYFTPQSVVEKMNLKPKGMATLETTDLVMPKIERISDSLLEEAWISVAKSVARNTLIREQLKDEGDFERASEHEDKE